MTPLVWLSRKCLLFREVSRIEMVKYLLQVITSTSDIPIIFKDVHLKKKLILRHLTVQTDGVVTIKNPVKLFIFANTYAYVSY